MKATKLFLIMFFLACVQLTMGQASLYVLNPQNNWYWRTGTIEKATVSVKPAGAYFEMGLYLTFSSSGSGFTGDIQLETYMNFNLPSGSIILDSWLWVGEEIVQGKIIDRWTASNIYEDIVDRRRDPSILMKNGPDNYELRVYPMKPGEQRKVKITYLVPASWNNGKAVIPMPNDLVRASQAIPTLHTLLWLDAGWTDPDIPEIEEDHFEQMYDADFGNYYRLDIPDHAVEKSLSLRLNAPLTNGLFLSTSRDQEGNGFYQLALDFGQFVDQDEAVKVAILIDYEPGNSDYSRSQVISTLEQYLSDNYTSTDSFNLFYSRYEVESYAEGWVSITPDAVSEALQPLKEGKTLYSNLPGLIARGNEFVQDNGGGDILLYSNADNYGSQEKANQLISDIKTMNPVSVHVADFQNLNFSSNYIRDRWYSGQEYFFINLSRVTGGDYERVTNHQNLNALCNEVFGALSGSITAFDLYTAAQDGFCYARYNSSNAEVYHLGDYFIQTGRFVGSAPFTLYLTGLYKNEPFNHLVQIEASQTEPGDSLLSKAWYGQHIHDLEWSATDNEQVNAVIAESIEQRVLSRYTAFLCLEPSDTVAVCSSCSDESRLTGIDPYTSMTTDSLQVYPNPCSDYATITFVPGSDWSADHTEIDITSATGQKVYSEQPTLLNGQKYTFKWDLSGLNGQRVASGIYFVSVRNNQYIYRKTLIVN